MHLEYQSPTTLVLYDTSRGCPEVVETFTNVTDVKRLQASLSQTFGRVRLLQTLNKEPQASDPKREKPFIIQVTSYDELIDWEQTIGVHFALRIVCKSHETFNVSVCGLNLKAGILFAHYVRSMNISMPFIYWATMLFNYDDSDNECFVNFYDIKPIPKDYFHYNVSHIDVYNSEGRYIHRMIPGNTPINC